MAYDETLADRLRKVLSDQGLAEKKMFGGMAFLMRGHMVCGVIDDKIVLRLGNEGAAEAVQCAGIVPMDFTGKPMKSMVYLLPEAHSKTPTLKKWLAKAVALAESFPPK